MVGKKYEPHPFIDGHYWDSRSVREIWETVDYENKKPVSRSKQARVSGDDGYRDRLRRISKDSDGAYRVHKRIDGKTVL